MMYKDKIVTANAIKDVSNLLSPFYNIKIINMVKNTKLIDALDNKHNVQHYTPAAAASPKHTYRRVLF